MNDHEDMVTLAVVGAHLSGQPLNHQLTDLGATLLETIRTTHAYRLYALRSEIAKPGLVRVSTSGVSIEVELWGLTFDACGRFVAALPQPMTMGKVELLDGRLVLGFLVEPIAIENAQDISEFGGWRRFLANH